MAARSWEERPDHSRGGYARLGGVSTQKAVGMEFLLVALCIAIYQLAGKLRSVHVEFRDDADLEPPPSSEPGRKLKGKAETKLIEKRGRRG